MIVTKIHQRGRVVEKDIVLYLGFQIDPFGEFFVPRGHGPRSKSTFELPCQATGGPASWAPFTWAGQPLGLRSPF